MFESSGKINEELLSKIKKYLMPSKQRIAFILLEIFSILMAVKSLVIFKDSYGWIFILTSILVVIEYFYVLNRFYKINVQRLEENVGKREARYNTYFNDEEVVVNNLDTGGKSNIKYTVLKKCIELSDIFVIFTKADQYIVVFKDNWNSKKVDEFKTFISEKCNKIKFFLKL